MPGEHFLHALTRDKGLKLLSLGLAVVVWYGIREAISFETELSDVPFEILHDQGWAVLDRTDATVDIRFRGSRADVRDLSRDQVRVVVDARGEASTGPKVLPIVLTDVEAPPGARPVYIRPDQVTFQLDREGERQVPVKANVQGTLPEGYEIEDVVCTPATVTVRGPSTKLETVEAVRTAAIDLEGRLQSFRIRKPLTPPAAGWTARIEPDRVMVDVAIVEHSAVREIENLPVLLLCAPTFTCRVRIDPDTVKVSLQGRQEVLKNLAPESVRAYIDCTGLDAAARYDLPVQVHLPVGVRLAGVQPKTVAVTVGELPTLSRP